MQPPIAKKIPKTLDIHGHQRVDPYYWLNEREDPAVIAYLEAENAYTKAMMKHTQALQEDLFEEMKGRIKEDDSSAPFFYNTYWYYSRYEIGKEYPLYCRRKRDMTAPEEIMLNVNEVADGHDYCAVAGGFNVSPDNRLLAYPVDTVSRRIYTVYIKNLETGALLSDIIPQTTGNVVWANDNRTLFYSRQDPQTLRSYQIYRHTLGEDPAKDVLVYEEPDDTYRCYIYKSKSEKYLIITSGSTLSDEAHILEADQPDGRFRLFEKRERGHEYGIDHAGEQFYIRSNWKAKNFRLMRCAENQTGRPHWEEVIPHRQDVLLQGMEVFKDYLVLRERKDGLSHIRIKPWEGAGEHYLPFEEDAYMVNIGYNPAYDTFVLRYGYQSMTTPASVYAYDIKARSSKLLKAQPVLGGFDRTNYRSERIWIQARDGVKVPVSLVYHKNTPLDSKAPLLLYAYGSYGASMDPHFSSNRLSLLDRGFIYALAHIRGGQELGRQWYENGRLLHKKNTFYDYIDCAEALVTKGYTSQNKLYAMGGSAGGLLMGAVLNMRPDLWHGMVAQVPFVDVITTMLDESIPLTTGEYDEWGNPNEKPYYDYILSYSPYDNVEAKSYTNLLVTTGLHDSQVQYWEPAKWVAKLRDLKTDEHRLLLHTNMEAGHGGASGRFQALKELALEYAFLLDLERIKK